MAKLINNITHNIDKLPLEAVGMIYYLLAGKIEGFENAYMAEVKLDDPLKHIKNGDEYFIIYQDISEYQKHAKHLGDKDWASIHKNMFGTIADVDEKRFETLLKKYFESGQIEIIKETGNIMQEVRQKMF
jgi:hypothetical protein